MARTHDEARLRETLASILKENAGLRFPSISDAVLQAILGAVCASFGKTPPLTPQALLEAARGEGDKTFQRQLLENFSNKSTEFFRDKRIFTFLVDALLKKSAQKKGEQKELVVWCAACSTGQEALSLAMAWQKNSQESPPESPSELPSESPLRLVVYASDLSAKAIEAARIGRYNNFDVQHGLNVYDLLGFFEEQPGGGFWKAKSDLLAHVTFFQHNLLHAPPAFLPPRLDAILLPHTLQNFHAAAAEGVCARLVSLLAPDGFLVLAPDEVDACANLLLSGNASSLSSDAVPKGVFSRQDFR